LDDERLLRVRELRCFHAFPLLSQPGIRCEKLYPRSGAFPGITSLKVAISNRQDLFTLSGSADHSLLFNGYSVPQTALPVLAESEDWQELVEDLRHRHKEGYQSLMHLAELGGVS
ncbi:MAG: hypothetical protein QNJ13_16485, partial [Paracoccaceae bacterium]|nr:hypothetical protein [Paracoccaceae bacterium]